MLKKLENPDISKITADKIVGLLGNEAVNKLVQKSLLPYAHWVKVKHWQTPNKVSSIEIWAAIKFFRNFFNRKKSPVRDEKGKYFSWAAGLPGQEEFLHQIDMRLGGNLFVAGNEDGEEMRHRLLSRGVMEEAIASSQLEGAHTSRKAAKQIIMEGRKPRNQDERMIINNYQAMLRIEDELKNKNLDEDCLLDLHRILTEGVLDESDIARYRKDDDNIIVGDDGAKDEIYHVPPNEEFVKKEIKRFIAYANDEIKDAEFIHPVIKAIVLHFWFGYLHPFVDGNGRMARALFYWYLLRKKYWAFGFLPLSKVIKNSPGQYRDAYLFTEQDDNDLTYFIEYNIQKISQAMREFDVYAQRKWKENTRMAKISREKYKLNDRQIQLLRYYYKNSDASTSVTTHMHIYETSRLTAAKDLKQLQKYGLVDAKKNGRNVLYYATDKINDLFD